MNIPIYRAKKLDSAEYVEGDLFAGKFIIPISILNKKIFNAIKHIEEDVLSCSINEDCKNEHIELKNMLTKLIYNERLEHITEIDITTLAIHFPDMLDSEGNKIFASLSKDGKGGDIVPSSETSVGLTAVYKNGNFNFVSFPLDDYKNATHAETYSSYISNTRFDHKGKINYHRKTKVIGIQE